MFYRIAQTIVGLYAIAAVASGCLLSYDVDPISGKMPLTHDGLAIMAMGYFLCLFIALLEMQRQGWGQSGLLVNGKRV